MSEMEDKLNAILSNPDMMQQIMSMAQAMGQENTSQDTPYHELSMPDIDINMLKKLGGLAQTASVDTNQQTLLHALRPYLATERIGKLEKAMRAAKMAKLASGFLSQPGLLSLQSR